MGGVVLVQNLWMWYVCSNLVRSVNTPSFRAELTDKLNISWWKVTVCRQQGEPLTPCNMKAQRLMTESKEEPSADSRCLYLIRCPHRITPTGSQKCRANQGAILCQKAGRSKTLRKAVLGNASTTITICPGKASAVGNDERKGLDILKHMEYDRIFKEKGSGLARDVVASNRISIEQAQATTNAFTNWRSRRCHSCHPQAEC